MKAFQLVSAVVTLVLPGALAAQDFFAKLDTDGNGVLTQAELRTQAALRGSWIAIDRDQNGRVTRNEFTSFSPAQMRRAERAPTESASGGGTAPAPRAAAQAPAASNAPPANVTVVIVDADRHGVPQRYVYGAPGYYPYGSTPSGYPPLFTQPDYEYGPLGVMPPWPR